MTEQTAPPAGRHLAAEIATQPEDWLRVAAQVGRHGQALPQLGERVAVIGCGTSLYMAQSYSVLREQAGHGITARRAGHPLFTLVATLLRSCASICRPP